MEWHVGSRDDRQPTTSSEMTQNYSLWNAQGSWLSWVNVVNVASRKYIYVNPRKNLLTSSRRVKAWLWHANGCVRVKRKWIWNPCQRLSMPRGLKFSEDKATRKSAFRHTPSTLATGEWNHKGQIKVQRSHCLKFHYKLWEIIYCMNQKGCNT